MKCPRCSSLNRTAHFTAKVDELLVITIAGQHIAGNEIPSQLGVGYQKYVDFAYCLHCGQMQGKFPKDTNSIPRFGEV